jgi:hypothetical protein
MAALSLSEVMARNRENVYAHSRRAKPERLIISNVRIAFASNNVSAREIEIRPMSLMKWWKKSRKVAPLEYA